MSVLNVMAINTPEFRSLRAFVVLYTGMWLFILALLASIYYMNEKEVMLSEHRLSMQLVNENYYEKMKYIYLYQDGNLPHSIAYNTAVFDAEKKRMVSYLEDTHIDFDKVISLKNGFIHFIVPIGTNMKGAKYLVYETQDNRLWWKAMVKDFIIYGVAIFVFITIIGINLVRIFLRPMQESILLLDNFIKDTTHELNTPVAAIVANIETIDRSKLEPKEAKGALILPPALSQIYITILLISSCIMT